MARPALAGGLVRVRFLLGNATETVERAIVFDEASDQRRAAALRCLDMCISAVDEALAQTDLGLRKAGPALFVILRLDADRFTDGHHQALTNASEHAGGRLVSLSELEYQERGAFLTRFAECELQRLAVAPDQTLDALDSLFLQPSDRRTEVRHAVDAPAVVKSGDLSVQGALQNLSAGGALFQPGTSAPVMNQSVQLEATLPGGDVKADATVVNVSAKGISLQFAPAFRGVVKERLRELPQPRIEPRGTVDALVSAPTQSKASAAVEKVGPFEVLGLLGTGATGQVHFARATDGKLIRQLVALKRLDKRRAQDPAAVRAFEAEAATLARFKHPNIIKVLDSGVFDGQHCLVTELVEGWDLAQLVRRLRAKNQRLPIEVACYVVKVLLDALAAVHAVPLVHGDVSPHNVFVSKSGAIKLGDFGLSGSGGESLSWKQRRLTYLSPEAMGGVFSSSVDLWAAGVMLYELLTFEAPFAGETAEAVLAAIRSGREVPLREKRDDCSGPLEALVRSTLEKDAKLRFQTAGQFASALSVHFHPVRAPRQLTDVLRAL